MTFPSAPLPRLLDRAEAFFWLLDRHSSMNFCVLAEGAGALAGTAVSAALPGLQARHPLLAVAVGLDADQRLCFTPAQMANPRLLESSATPETWRTVLAEAMVQSFALGDAPLFRAHLIHLPAQRWVLALTFHHSIGDARSGFTVLGELLRLAAGSADALPALPARPPLLDLYPDHWRDDAGRQAAEALKIIKREENKALGMPAALPGYEEHPRVEAPDFVSLHYPADWLARLGQQARQAGASLHGVIGAAQLLAVRRQIPGDDHLVLSLTSPADLRPTLQPPMDTATPGFYVTLLTQGFAVRPDHDFWALAREVSARNREQFERGDGHLLYHFFPPAEQFPISAAGQAAFDDMMRRGPQTTALSNVGRLPPLDGLPGLQLEHLSFALCPAPKQPFFASAATHAGRLTINLNYDRKRLPAPLLQAMKQEFDTQLHYAAAGNSGSKQTTTN